MLTAQDYPMPDQALRVDTTVNNIVFAVATAIAVVSIAAIVRRCKPSDIAVLAVLIAGSLAASTLEPLLDTLALIYNPRNQPLLFEAFAHPAPLIYVPFYCLFLAIFPFIIWQRLERGAGAREIWKWFGLFCLIGLLAEELLTTLHVYYYYGNQPLALWKVPLWVTPLNCVAPIIGAVLLYCVRSRVHGVRMLLFLPLPAACFVTSYAAAGWPTFTAINTNLSAWVTWPFAVITIGISIVEMFLLCTIVSIARQARSAPDNVKEWPHPAIA